MGRSWDEMYVAHSFRLFVSSTYNVVSACCLVCKVCLDRIRAGSVTIFEG